MKVRTMSWMRTMTAGFVLAGFAGTWGYLHSAATVGTSSATASVTAPAGATTSTGTGSTSQQTLTLARTTRAS
jgi:hypothetical protein